MASFALEKAVNASFSSVSSKPFSQGQRLFPSDCCCCSSASGWRSGRHRRAAARVRAVECGLKFQWRRDSSPLLPSSSSPCLSDEFVRGFSRFSVVQRLRRNGTSMERGRRGNGIVTMALPIDAYWITAAQALGVTGLMGGFAVVTGIIINIRIEVQALAEFKELEEKGLLPEDMIIPDGEDWELDAPLYIFQTKELSSANPSPRNRPVREEFEPQLEIEPRTELQIEPRTELEIEPRTELELEPRTELERVTELETATKE